MPNENNDLKLRYQYFKKLRLDLHKEACFIQPDPNPKDDDFFKVLNEKLSAEHGYFCFSKKNPRAITLVFHSSNKKTETNFLLTQHAYGIQVNEEYVFITDNNHPDRKYILQLNGHIKGQRLGPTLFEHIAASKEIALIYNLVSCNQLSFNEEKPLTTAEQTSIIERFNETANLNDDAYIWPLIPFTKNISAPHYFATLKYLTEIIPINKNLYFIHLESQKKGLRYSKFFILSKNQIANLQLNLILRTHSIEEKTKFAFLQHGFFKSDQNAPAEDDLYLLRMMPKLPKEIKEHILGYVFGADYERLKKITTATDKWYFLARATALGKNKIIKAIMQTNTRSFSNSENASLLQIAVKSEQYDEGLLQLLAGKNNCFIDWYDNQQHSALYHAALATNTEAIKTLVQLGATAEVNVGSNTPRNVLADIINDMQNYTHLYNALKAITDSNLEINSQVSNECLECISKKSFSEEEKQTLSDLLDESPSPCHTM